MYEIQKPLYSHPTMQLKIHLYEKQSKNLFLHSPPKFAMPKYLTNVYQELGPPSWSCGSIWLAWHTFIGWYLFIHLYQLLMYVSLIDIYLSIVLLCTRAYHQEWLPQKYQSFSTVSTPRRVIICFQICKNLLEMEGNMMFKTTALLSP